MARLNESAAPAWNQSSDSSDDYEVVVVTYHSRDQLAGLLEPARGDQRIVVVDNASGADGTQDELERFPNSRWLDGGNVGFARAANRGGLSSTAEFLIFANPDSRPTPEIWDELVADLRADPALAMVAAGTVDARGRSEIGVGGWEPTPLRTFVYAFGLHALFPHAGVYARPRRDESVDLEWLNGACVAVRRDVFANLGGFDERYFVYNEDMAFGRAIREAGLGQRLRTDMSVPHATGTSGGGGTAMFQQRGASMSEYLHDHNGRVAALIMRLTLITGTAPRAVLALLRRQDLLFRQHLAYINGLATKRSPYLPR